jgi:oxygen-dependent protoporphyrinogen oxidase
MPGTVVVGAGVSGLSAAHFVRRRLGPAHPLTVLERSSHPGGKVRTVDVAGLGVDTGPDAFLARATDLRALIDDLGLGSSVVEPLSSGAYVWSRGRLRPLPPGAAFGLPERLWPLLRSGLLSPRGVARAGLDLVLPTRPAESDPSVRDLVEPRFGMQVYQRLVEPLLGGVHAGDPAALSARSAVPQIASLAGRSRSLSLTMRARRARPDPSGRRPAPLVSLDGGMSRLTDALVDSLGTDTVLAGVAARSVTRGAGPTLTVRTDAGELDAETVIVATPAWAAADILEAASAPLAGLLRGIPYVDVANVTLAVRARDVAELPPGTGFLVPPVEQQLIVGCSWLTRKWPHLDQDEVVLIKAMVGRYGDVRWTTMTDAELVDRVRGDLRVMMGFDAPVVDTLVQRWPASMPQYVVGHADRLDAIDRELARLGSVHLTGAAYRGVGLAGCVAQASATVERIAAGVRA